MELLIAEDDKVTCALLKKTLSASGHDVITFENGLLAWQYMQTKPIRLVVTDWAMPQLDGLSLCRNIRGASFDHYVYLIMLTSRDDKKDLLAVFQAGADDYIKKPFDPDELSARVFTGLRILERDENHRRRQQDILNVAAHIKLKNQRLEAALANSSVEVRENELVAILLEKVEVGMVLAQDLRLRDGLLLLTKGTLMKNEYRISNQKYRIPEFPSTFYCSLFDIHLS